MSARRAKLVWLRLGNCHALLHCDRLFAHCGPLFLPSDARRFLVPLWLCAIYLNDIIAAALGVVWIGGRVLYFTGYSKAVQKRLPGFFVQSAACTLLFIAALVGVVLRWASR